MGDITGPAGHTSATPQPYRVVVADDADGVRELICLLLDMEPDFEVVGQARDGAEAVRVARTARPDLVLLDVAMPVLDGLAALPRILVAVPHAHVVIFTGFSETSLARQALRLGADAIVEKGGSADELVEQLREIAHRVVRGPHQQLRVTG